MRLCDSQTCLLLIYIIIIIGIQDTETTESAKTLMGGPCISSAQRQCQVQGSNLWTAQHENQTDKICSYFKQYQGCIVSHMKQCNYQQHERELHQMDIVDHYVNPPYNCPVPEQYLDSSVRQQQQQPKKSSQRNSSSSLCTISILYVIVMFYLAPIDLL